MKDKKNKSDKKVKSEFAKQIEEQRVKENPVAESKSGKKPDEKTEPKIPLIRIIQMVFVFGIFVCAVILTVQTLHRKKAESTYDNLQKQSTEDIGATLTDATGSDAVTTELAVTTEAVDITESQTADTVDGIYIPEKNLDWDALRQENGDIYAWIYIPGTAVDYPVLQSSKEDEDYYLDHNLDGSSGYPGCIYTQRLNTKDFTDFDTVLYGHNMKDGTMFKSLHDYSDETFFNENKYIYIYTPEKTLVYEIFAAVRFGNGNVLLDYDMSQDIDRSNYINDLRNNRDMMDTVDENVVVNSDSHIITLSTCLSDNGATRWLVNGVLIEQ